MIYFNVGLEGGGVDRYPCISCMDRASEMEVRSL